MQPKRLFLYVPLCVLLCASYGMAHQETEQLWQVHFAVSCSTEAQPQFDRAIALLHSFWYSEAVKAFTAVTATDPGCAMGSWGVAMSLWYPLWQPPSEAMLKQGAEAVTQARAIGGKSAREQEYIAAIEAFYQDWRQRDHRTRALAYEQAMERLYARYPDDREAAVFYALALNATAQASDAARPELQHARAFLAQP